MTQAMGGALRDEGRLRSSWMLVAVVAGAFAPYLAPGMGIRMEHVVVYGFGLWGLGVLLMAPKGLRPTGLQVALVFSAVAVLTLLVTFLGPIRERDTLAMISNLDHLLRPVALAFGVGAWALDRDVSSIRAGLRTVCAALIVFLSLNALLSLSANFFDVESIVRLFRSARDLDPTGGDTGQLWLDFEHLGRVTGIFGLPFDAGVAYSVGLLSWAYLTKGSRSPISMTMYLGLVLVVVGGLLPVSKAFLLGGIPLTVLYLVWRGSLARLLSARTVFVLLIGVLGFNVVLSDWAGSESTVSLLDSLFGGESIVDTATAGRFGTDEAVITDQTSDLVESNDLLIGIGLGVAGLLDSAYFAFLVQGGVVALLAYCALLVYLFGIAWRRRNYTEEARLLVVLVAFIVGAGLGAPVTSVVRASTVLWLVLLLALAVVQREMRNGFSRGRRPLARTTLYSGRPLTR